MLYFITKRTYSNKNDIKKLYSKNCKNKNLKKKKNLIFFCNKIEYLM